MNLKLQLTAKMTEVWMNRKTGQLVLVTPIYMSRKTINMETDYDISIDMFEEIGLSFENEYGVMIILPHEVRKHFEILGEF